MFNLRPWGPTVSRPSVQLAAAKRSCIEVAWVRLRMVGMCKSIVSFFELGVHAALVLLRGGSLLSVETRVGSLVYTDSHSC